MNTVITVRLPQKLQRNLSQVARREGRSRSEIVREVLGHHLWMSKMDQSRKKVIPRTQKMGIFTDEDVLKKIALAKSFRRATQDQEVLALTES